MTTATSTVREIVAADYRAAAVFHRFGIDFCCRGGRELEHVCRELHLDPSQVLAALDAECAPAPSGVPRFASWDCPALISYIVANHHAYVRQAIPTLLAHTGKVARVHGARHPELVDVARLFEAVAQEMTSHMAKEEHVLFPYVMELSDAVAGGDAAPPAPFGTVENPIRMMEMEHETAGDAMARIRALSGDYCAPEDACETFRVCYRELEAFEHDLHAHVHLENNILFPKAIELERS
jgi:regulator of cell morphogenesis and NO signaling